MKLTDEMLRCKIINLYAPCDAIIYKGTTAERRVKALGAYLGTYEVEWVEMAEYAEDPDPDSLPDYKDINHFHLILTPLSKITDEDAEEITKFIYGESYEPINGDKITRIVQSCRNDLFFTDIDNTTRLRFSAVRDISDFIRSKGYALPYMGIDLFEAGIAIEKQ